MNPDLKEAVDLLRKAGEAFMLRGSEKVWYSYTMMSARSVGALLADTADGIEAGEGPLNLNPDVQETMPAPGLPLY